MRLAVRRSRVVVLLIVSALLAGCSNFYTPEGTYGYRVRQGDVRFTFRPRRYPWTTFAATGDSVPIRDLRVRRVAVELFYDDGTRERIALDDGENGFTRRVRLDRFRERTPRGFSFVVNRLFIAEPPRAATNRIEATGKDEPRLRLELPSRD